MDDDRPLLPGIGFAGYRSFATWQPLWFPTKVTVLAGVNNSGKSNILKFLQHVAPQLQTGGSAPQQQPGLVRLEALDRPRGFDRTSALEVGVPIPVGSFGDRQDPRANHGHVEPRSLAAYQEGAMSLLADEDGIYWSRFIVKDNQVVPSQVDTAMAEWPAWDSHFDNALYALGGGAVNARSVMERLLTSIGGFSAIPNVVTISSARRVEATGDAEPDWLSGRGIIRALGALQNPPHDQWDKARPRWAAINQFVRVVLGDEDTSLNVPHDFSTIQVETPQRVLPLASMGSGVEQVIVLAAAATVTTSSLVCVEEPETNLHPLLQKKLIRYLTDETDNQYVVATHSSHLLDDSRSTTYHVRLTTHGSLADLARRPHELIEICHDLGYRPSDLLQANCVIWVEGPSDRIYIRRWLELMDPQLAEGIDYTIMFYGGKLLAHLTASHDALADFISLRRLNRASAIVIDSDKKSSRARINETKQRIKAEFKADEPANGFAWVTNCYTIENYVPADVLKAAVEATHARTTYTPADQWENPLPSGSGNPRFDKIAIALTASEALTPEHLDQYDLKRQLSALRQFIHTANGQSVAPEPVD